MITTQNKVKTRQRLKQVCLNAGINQIQFVKKYYNSIIPKSKGGVLSAYSNIQSTLNPNCRSKIQPWLIEAIEMEEMECSR